MVRGARGESRGGTMKRTIFTYICTNRQCRQFRKEYTTAMSPAGIKEVTGRPFTCSDCNTVQLLKKVEPLDPTCELAKAMDKLDG